MSLVKVIGGICLLSGGLCSQVSAPAATPGGAPSGPPTYILYRLFFRDIAAQDAAAAKSNAQGMPGGNLARKHYQQILSLTDAEAAALKQSAGQCNLTLDQHQQKAQPTILAMQQAQAASSDPGSLPAQLAALENERTAISNACIQSLQATMGTRKFADIDVFVRTKFAQKISAIPPANAPFAHTPVSRTGGGK